MVVWRQFDQALIKCFKVFHQSFCLVLGLAKFSVNLFNTSFLDLRMSLVTKFLNCLWPKNREELNSFLVALKLLSSSYQMHASYQLKSNKFPRCDNVQRQEQTTTYGSLYEPSTVTPPSRSYTSFYLKSPELRTIDAFRKNPHRIFTNYTPTKFYLTTL